MAHYWYCDRGVIEFNLLLFVRFYKVERDRHFVLGAVILVSK